MHQGRATPLRTCSTHPTAHHCPVAPNPRRGVAPDRRRRRYRRSRQTLRWTAGAPRRRRRGVLRVGTDVTGGPVPVEQAVQAATSAPNSSSPTRACAWPVRAPLASVLAPMAPGSYETSTMPMRSMTGRQHGRPPPDPVSCGMMDRQSEVAIVTDPPRRTATAAKATLTCPCARHRYGAPNGLLADRRRRTDRRGVHRRAHQRLGRMTDHPPTTSADRVAAITGVDEADRRQAKREGSAPRTG